MALTNRKNSEILPNASRPRKIGPLSRSAWPRCSGPVLLKRIGKPAWLVHLLAAAVVVAVFVAAYGGVETDEIYGEAGNDILYGNDGPDKIHGGQGDDIIYGGDGDDTIRGNAGTDTIYPGAGSDAVLGNSPSDNVIENAIR